VGSVHRCTQPDERDRCRGVQTEIRSALDDELLDVESAAELLDMTEGALRKAVERGQVPCQRVGSRLRFRRMALLAGHQRTPTSRSRVVGR